MTTVEVLRTSARRARVNARMRIQRTLGNWRMRLLGGFWNGSRRVPYQNSVAGNALLTPLIRKGAPLMLARFGVYELTAMVGALYQRPAMTRNNLKSLCNNAGFFPEDVRLMDRFANIYAEATREIDVLAVSLYRQGLWVWEERAFRDYCPEASIVDIRVTDSFRFEEPWTEALRGKKVLVIHPFNETIERQYVRRSELFANPRVLPEFASLQTIRAVQSIAGNPVPFTDWFAALQHMCDEIDKKDFDVALIGAGAYGFALAAHVKRRGKQGLHLGGVTQMLFGIRGRRWNDWYGYLYNDSWVNPAESERPQNISRVENGCYW